MQRGRDGDTLEASQTPLSLPGPAHITKSTPKAPPGDVDGAEPEHEPFPIQVRDPRRYQLVGEHGRGGLGRVSRSRDRELGRDVAIKEMLSRGTTSEARFLREVLITARLEHPGIVPMYEAGRWPDGTPFYAMKLVSGRPLRDLIAERKTVDQRIGLLHHVIAVADAIAYAHARNIIHRDLKPANVIVGDFGETIVIDWGLAKDLSATEDHAEDSQSSPGGHNTELTAAGTIVGTPSYMAPEQERGGPVDQRADVFAIGAMLWELCSVQKVPPTDIRQRHRMLRRDGIDRDLVVILDKALERDPERRYPDAGALAADLKAFKSGARIAARDYSLFATLAHWTRRHRTFALSATATVALAVIGSFLYVHSVGVERDRADSSLDELTLKHAELLLTTDPSAAVDALRNYHGPDASRVEQIRAEATGRGIAFVRARPHTDKVTWVGAAPDGAIISFGMDGTIARTYFDGTSSVLARGVSKVAAVRYAPAKQLLAYTCDPSDLCLFDVARAVRMPLGNTLQGGTVNGAAFSPNGTVLAVLALDGTLRLLDVTDPVRPAVRLVKLVASSKDVTFVDDDVVALVVEGGLEFVRMSGDSEQLPLPTFTRWAAGATDHQLVIADANGSAAVVESFPARVVARTDLCHGAVSSLDFIPERGGIAYSCREGTVGTWDARKSVVRPRSQLEGRADFVLAGPTGDYIVAAGGNGTVAVIDLVTELVTSYKGHGIQLGFLMPPSPQHPFIISSDARGAVRAWPLPPRLVRVAATSSSPFSAAIFGKKPTIVATTTWLPAVMEILPSSGVRAIEPHDPLNIFLVESASGKTFATHGLQDIVEIWSSETVTRRHVIATGHGSVSQLQFLDNAEEFVTSGHDGRLIHWTSGGAQRVVTHLDQPIDKFALLPAAGEIVFATMDGALWRSDSASHNHLLKQRSARINHIIADTDHRRVYIGYADGDLLSIDTKSWRQETLIHGFGGIRKIALATDSHAIAIITIDGAIHVGMRRDEDANPEPPTWVTLIAHASDIALTTDDLLVATSNDGTIWLCSVTRRRWLSVSTGITDLDKIVTNADGDEAIAVDRQGRLISIDLDAARKLLDAAR